MHHLTGKKIATVVDGGFEQVELVEPRKALEEAGATTEVVSPRQKSSRCGITRIGEGLRDLSETRSTSGSQGSLR
jgi:putative intracellular protease/amidase